MAIETAADLVEALRQTRILGPAQLAEAAALAPRREPRALARELIERGWLTPYQVNQLFQGRGPALAVGSYVLLERLGEGGMGQVFKARHRGLERVVALKLIRKERLAHPDAVRRFLREIRAVAQLNHPNVVLAFDADEVDGVHYLAMEYVEATDLAKLVKRSKPLPVALACDYARQVALGLQHAFEHGLVHRDVKPSNLLLARGSVVKVVDLGLARLHHGGPDGEGSVTVTGQPGVMGTPDFIAPDQARDFHAADTRSDLYSLGCSLYFLLTGQVPFPEGTLTEKLLRHQLDDPRPVEEVRPEVPAEVAAVVRRLMAKQPRDRPQTPAEAAAALAAVQTRAATFAGAMPAKKVAVLSTPPPAHREAAAVQPTPFGLGPASQGPADTRVGWSSVILSGEPRDVPPSHSARKRGTRKKSLPWLVAAGTLALAGMALAVYLLARGPDKTGAGEDDGASAPAAGKRVYLSDLNESDVVVGYGRFGKKGATGLAEAAEIVVNGVPAPHGLSLHPPARGSSRVTYRLGKRYRTFNGTAAINDLPAGGSRSPLTFLVYGDDNLLWKCQPLRHCGETQACNVQVIGVDRLRLAVQCPDDATGASAVWVEPYVAR
jgi:serine/threonine-protein kinase